jgi:hypothetical protein
MPHIVHLHAVCSNKPRPSVQKGAKGHQYWRRDVFHLSYAGNTRTLCNRDSGEWLLMRGLTSQEAFGSPDLCARCKRVIGVQ